MVSALRILKHYTTFQWIQKKKQPFPTWHFFAGNEFWDGRAFRSSVDWLRFRRISWLVFLRLNFSLFLRKRFGAICWFWILKEFWSNLLAFSSVFPVWDSSPSSRETWVSIIVLKRLCKAGFKDLLDVCCFSALITNGTKLSFIFRFSEVAKD